MAEGGPAQRLASAPIGPPALLLLGLGIGLDLFELRPGGWFHPEPGVNLAAAISFGAFWLVLVLAAMAGRDLLAALDRGPERAGPGSGELALPAGLEWLRPGLVPGGFGLGLLLGHWFWP